jgi:hypothetical protein
MPGSCVRWAAKKIWWRALSIQHGTILSIQPTSPPLVRSFLSFSLVSKRSGELSWASALRRARGSLAPFIHLVSIRWRLPGQRADARVHRSWDRSQRCCGWGPHRHWRCLLAWPRCRGARPPHRLSPPGPSSTLDFSTGGLCSSRRWGGWVAARAGAMPASSSGLDLAAGTGLGALLPPSLPTGGILLVRAVSSPSRTLRRSGGIFSRRPLYSSQRHHRRPLLLPTDPLTSGSHLSGRTKNWAETVLTLILGRDKHETYREPTTWYKLCLDGKLSIISGFKHVLHIHAWVHTRKPYRQFS